MSYFRALFEYDACNVSCINHSIGLGHYSLLQQTVCYLSLHPSQDIAGGTPRLCKMSWQEEFQSQSSCPCIPSASLLVILLLVEPGSHYSSIFLTGIVCQHHHPNRDQAAK